MDIETRFKHAIIMAEHYADFRTFAADGMVYLGFSLTEIQDDIAEFMQSGPRLRMVMAQRGEAKSTLAALYAVWRLMQKPSTRVLIVSGGETQASEVATLVVRLITTWEIFEYLRPDRSAGDRTSITDGFDVHYALRGVIDKSPSVACVGITAQLQGKRADLLIPDDIETTKNGLTATQRAHLLQLSKEFSSICTEGHILYLGTPQTKDSIYNTLPGRGFTVRIWPGRYPTDEEAEKYGERLAPTIARRAMLNPALRTGGGIDGKRGAPTDPERYNEAALVEKELDQGPEGFQLQYMLDTSLSDAARQQLRLSDLIVANFNWESVPEVIPYRADPSLLVPLPATFPVPQTRMYYAANAQTTYRKLNDLMMYVDPAGGGADEMGFAISGSLGPYIHLLRMGGMKGGFKEDNIKTILSLLLEYQIKYVRAESNMGHGLFEINLLGELTKAAADWNGKPEPFFKEVAVEGEYSTGQKERRIIDSMVSSMQRHRVVIHQEVFKDDEEYGKQHAIDKRNLYSLWAQFSNITTDRNSLAHDDRIEAVAGAIRYHKTRLVEDEEESARRRAEEDAKEYMKNPMGYDEAPQRKGGGARALVAKRRARK
ncbi:terminase large subunit [Ralstonia phage RSB3]|uniref:Putative DNA maturase n=1 Tax=Ralstonia phage RSB3 TaxID=1402875 RepID=U3TFP0_9CAUD|nr:terminase large subunit [Ralstonia phage RSB3]BAN92357.1 putative DNA maturase [Ralstonia phage RSB3]